MQNYHCQTNKFDFKIQQNILKNQSKIGVSYSIGYNYKL